MKLKFLAILGALAMPAFGAVTVNVSNFSSASVGVPLVSSSGAVLDQGQAFMSAGYFSSGVSVGTSSLSELLAAFTAVDSTPVAIHATFDGLFTGQDFNGASLGSAVGQSAYILVGNAATLSESTAIAIYSSGTVFTAPDQFGNSAQTIAGTNVANWVVGTATAVTTQPSLANASYTTGIALVPIPEPSVAVLGLLGAAGLLRRRR